MTLREVLLRRGVDVLSTNKPNEIRICCLFCSDRGESIDERFRLGINLATGQGHCFNCGWASKHYAPVAVLRKLGVRDQVEGERTEIEEEPEAPELPSDFQLLSNSTEELDRLAMRYLRKRQITKEQIRRYQVGVSFVGRYAYRIVFPVLYRKELHGLVTRDFTGWQEPKYLNSPGIKSLYNIAPGKKYLVLSEGVFKALRIEQLMERCSEAYQCAAVLGKSITEEQIEQIKKCHYSEIVIWPDPDKAGRKGAADIAETLVDNGFTVGVIWPVYKPADEAELSEMEDVWKRNLLPYGWKSRQVLRLC